MAERQKQNKIQMNWILQVRSTVRKTEQEGQCEWGNSSVWAGERTFEKGSFKRSPGWSEGGSSPVAGRLGFQADWTRTATEGGIRAGCRIRTTVPSMRTTLKKPQLLVNWYKQDSWLLCFESHGRDGNPDTCFPRPAPWCGLNLPQGGMPSSDWPNQQERLPSANVHRGTM